MIETCFLFFKNFILVIGELRRHNQTDHKWDLNYKYTTSTEKLLLEAIRDIFSDQQIITKHQLESSLLLE